MSSDLKADCLNTTSKTPTPNPLKDARDEQLNEQRATGIFKLRPDMTATIERLALSDPIIYMVWNHYVNEKKTYPVAAHQIKYFWEKVAAELQTVQEDILVDTKGQRLTGNMHA